MIRRHHSKSGWDSWPLLPPAIRPSYVLLLLMLLCVFFSLSYLLLHTQVCCIIVGVSVFVCRCVGRAELLLAGVSYSFRPFPFLIPFILSPAYSFVSFHFIWISPSTGGYDECARARYDRAMRRYVKDVSAYSMCVFPTAARAKGGREDWPPISSRKNVYGRVKERNMRERERGEGEESEAIWKKKNNTGGKYI